MTYQDKLIEDILKELIKEMRDVTLPNNNEFRITKNKIGNFRIHLYKLYLEAFKQGVYTSK